MEGQQMPFHPLDRHCFVACSTPWLDAFKGMIPEAMLVGSSAGGNAVGAKTGALSQVKKRYVSNAGEAHVPGPDT
jgi:hypothetical protein